ncbi:MAG: sugar phosphate isomerase/epimerase family protein [Armatimonadota bacterium]|nr:sugar phosphate isomerase/epimerase family protein [Armatimonadota bacterium]
MKFACAAWGFREMSLPEYFQAAKRLGLDYVEVNVSPSTPKHLTTDAIDAQVEEMVRQASDTGVTVVALAGGNNFAAEDLASEIASVKRQIDMTAMARAQVLRIFAGWIGPSQFTDETFHRISGAMEEVGEYGAEQGVMVAVENHGGITATGAQCRRLLAEAAAGIPVTRVNKPLGLNYDPANFRHAGEDALAALMVAGDLINYSHWKDVRYEGDEPQYCAVGEGVIDWAPIVEMLLRSDFDGYWAIEYEEPSDVERGTRESLEHLRGLL